MMRPCSGRALAPSAAAARESASRSVDCAGAARRNTAARKSAGARSTKVRHLADPGRVEDRSRPQEEKPWCPRPGDGGLEPPAERAVRHEEIAAADVGDRRRIVSRAAVNDQHVTDEASRGARNQRAQGRDQRAFRIEGRNDDTQHGNGMNGACNAVEINPLRPARCLSNPEPEDHGSLFLFRSHSALL